MMVTSTRSPIQVFALLCYRLLLDDPHPHPSEEEIAAVRQLVGSDFNPGELVQLSLKLRMAPNFSAKRERLINRWNSLMASNYKLSELRCRSFLDDFFNDADCPIDRSLLFDYSLMANRAHAKRGEFTDRDNIVTGTSTCWALHVTTNGQALYFSEMANIATISGSLMLFHPNARCHYGLHPSADHWEHIWVLFQPPAHWRQWMEWENLDCGIQHLQLSDDEQYEILMNLLEKIILLRASSIPYVKELQYNLLEEFFIRAAGYRFGQQAAVVDRRVEQACKFIEKNFSRRITINEVASFCNLSASRLTHLFKDHMGISPKAWMNNIRLQQAHKLLVNSDLRIGQVASTVGFSDSTLFVKNFKKNFGCTPSQFRSLNVL